MAGKEAARKYPAPVRAEALHLYAEVGPAEAARRLDLPAGTVRSWAKRAGVTGERTKQATAAVEAARLTWSQRKAELVTRTGEAAADFLERSIAAAEAGDTRDVRDLVNAFGVAVDKAQLLDGEATERVEVSADERRERVAKLRDELAARREGKADGGEA